MQPIQAPIKQDESGAQVANLQDALLELANRGLIQSLSIPDRTAPDRLLAAMPSLTLPSIALLSPARLAPFLVNLSNADALSALVVKVRSERGNQPQDAKFGEATGNLLALFQVHQGLEPSPNRVDAETAYRLNAVLVKAGVQLDGDGFVVMGRVTDSQRRVQAGLVVIAYDRDLRRWQELGRTETDTDGLFVIRYAYESYRQAEGKVQPELDLVLQVARRLDNEDLEPLFTQEEQRPVPPVATVDVVIPAPPESQPSEFERVTALIMPLLVGQGDERRQRPTTIAEGPSVVPVGAPRYTDLAPHAINADDVAFIVRETGLEVDAVSAWVWGARLQTDALRLLGEDGDPAHRAALVDHELTWALGFSWRRMGWSNTLSGLLADGQALWTAALDGGAERSWIPQLEPASRKGFVAALTYLQSVVTVDPEFSRDPFAKATAPYTGDLPREIAAAAIRQFREGGDAALDELPGLAGDNVALQDRLGTLARAIRLHALAEGHAALIKPLLAKLDGLGTDLNGLLTLGADDWQGYVAKTLPDEGQGNMLAYRMQATVEQKAPADALLVRLDQESISMAPDDASAFRQAVAKNMETVNQLLQDRMVESGNPFVDLYPGQADAITKIGQFSKVGFTMVDSAKFVETGSLLPNWITNYGADRPFGPTGPDGPLGTGLNPMITAILNSVRERFKKDLESVIKPGYIFTGLIGRRHFDATVPTFDPPAPRLPGITSPTVRGMFGDLDDCVCRPCESVTGPAAYLVELLRALQWGVFMQDTSGLQLLRARRPDILDLELSCENADVLVPHIDLALEQLEFLAAQPDLVFGAPAETNAVSFLTPSSNPLTDIWQTVPLNMLMWGQDAIVALQKALLVALLQRTTDRPIDIQLEAQNRLRQNPLELVWLVREKSGARSWLIEWIAAGPNGWRGWRVLGMAIRRSTASPDPRVEPAERNPEAYRLLAAAGVVFPWTLPFVATRHERDAVLKSLRVDPLQVGPLLPAYGSQITTGNTLDSLDRDTLGLNAAETLIVVTAASGDDIWRAWGFVNGSAIASIDDPASGETLTNKTAVDLLPRASFLLARSALSLDDLEAALATNFVGGYLLSGRDQCKTSAMRAERGAQPNVQAINGPALDRLHRLVRLWRKLPAWPLATLDSALRSMNDDPTAQPLPIGGDELRLLAAMERARRALELTSEELLSLRLPLDGAPSSLEWQRRHSRLARALGRPMREVLELLQWLGFPAAGLGTAGDPLRTALDAIDGATTVLAAVRQSRKLAARAADFDRLASLRGWSEAFAECDVPLTTLVAAQLTALQGRQTTAPRPEGAKTSAVLNAALLELRRKLALVPEPVPQPTGSQLVSALDEELKQQGWTAALLTSLRGEFATPSAGGFGSELLKALSNKVYALGSDAPRALLTTAEIAAIAASSTTPDQRSSFVLDRIIERRGTQERDVLTRLTKVLGEAATNSLLLRLKSLVATVRSQAASEISAASLSGRNIGEAMPLFTNAEMARFINPAMPDTWRLRLDLVDARLAERERERVVLDEVMNWAAQSGADWPIASAAAFLADRLTIEPATGSATGRPRFALEQFLSTTFYGSTSSTPPPAELSSWLERLDTVLALHGHSPAAVALAGMPGEDWRLLLNAETGAEARGHLPNLLRLLNARHLGAQTLATVLDPASPRDRALSALATRLDLAAPEVEALAIRAAKSTAGPITAQQLRDPATLMRLFELVEVARRLKASTVQLDALVGSDLSAAITAGKALLAQSVGSREWPKQLRRLNDESRRLRRDALVSYLVQRMPGAKDADALFEQMLIDPQVQPCMETTRLKQATAAVQMLIQRILEGLEPRAQATDKLRKQWSWMRSYRLWEANRKVFLYPENWLLPELRDDKSPEFRALESRIAEDELTPSRANLAFGQFLEDVNGTAQTRVLGMFEQADVLPNPAGTRPLVRNLLVVGRTPNPPYVHYWRQCRDFGKRWMEWSPWERVEADIQGDHIVPFVAQDALYLAWPKIEDLRETASSKWKIELAWSRFDGAGWGKVNVSRGEALVVDSVPLEDHRSALALRAHVPLSGQVPRVYAYLKVPALGTTNRVGPPDPKRESPLSAPSFLLDASGIPKVAKLLSKVFDKLPKASRDLVELYLHWSQDQNLVPPSLHRRTLGYTVILRMDLFTNPQVLRNHLTWVRGDDDPNVDLTEQGVRGDVKRQRYQAANLEKFLTVFRTQTYVGGSTPNRYSELLRHIMAECSAVEFTYAAWAHLGTGLLRLNGNEAESFMIDHEALGTSPVSLLPGLPSGIRVTAGPTSGSQATLSLSKTGKTIPPAISSTVQAVPTGWFYAQTLHFEFSDLINRWEFPLPPQDRVYRQSLNFSLSPTGAMEGTIGDQTPLMPLDNNSAVWMGGLREVDERINVNGHRTPVEPSLPVSFARVFPQNLTLFPRSASTYRYELIAAGVTGTSALSHTGIWHFSEGISSCYVDTNRELDTVASSAKTLIYPAAWLSGGRLLQAWYGEGRLLSWNEQADDFGVQQLPEVATSAVPATALDMDRGVAKGRGAFDNRMPHSGYWWEICFHAPMAIADQLTRQQRFQDADRWLRVVFDPLTSTTGDPQAFLRFRRFRELPRARGVRSDLAALAKAAANSSSSPSPSVERVRATIDRWRSQPFRPFVIARQRHIAFLWRTLFAYLDNLMAWADSLYRRETRESIQEALLLYVQVARLLGLRPRHTRQAASRPAASFVDYQDKWDEFANAWLRELPAVPAPLAAVTVSAADEDAPVEGMLYFCVPPNDRILKYWDMVEERLTNIRHCRTIDGVERALPIEAPEIDLDELLRAVASGSSPDQFMAEAFAQPWPYRYATLLAHAKELVNDVRNLGAQLLGALEKHDAEKLSLLRSTHELALQERVTEIRKQQVIEAERQLDSLRSSRDSIAARYEQLQHQLGTDGAVAPGRNESVGPESRLGRLSGGNQHADSNLGLITQEADQLEQLHYSGWWTDADSVARLIAMGFNIAAAGSHIAAIWLPKPMKDVADSSDALGKAAAAAADGSKAIAQIHQTQASRLAQTASNIRRRDEWAHQSNQALRELATADKQMLASEARLEIVKKELANHELQREQSAATDDYLRDKFTNAALYQWQSSQLLTLYRSSYGLALRLAKRARQAAAREIASKKLPAIRDQWSDGRNGLMAAEQLQREVKLLELAVLEQSTRELELTRHISLRRLNPQALLDLIATGRGDFEIPEWLFDLDAPGHYLRRIKSVGVTIPCVTGPYTAINARLTLLRSDVRTEPLDVANYARGTDEDRRFETRFHASESVFISTGREDTGLFETNLRDERYLPFEGAGAISKWRIDFPSQVQQFDRTSISDAVLHVRYTARDAGESLSNAAKAALLARWATAGDVVDMLLSLRTDFSAEWTRASQAKAAEISVEVNLKSIVPYWMQAANVMSVASAADVRAVGLRRSDQSASAVLGAVDGVALRGNRLTIPLGAAAWAGLGDVLVVLQVRRNLTAIPI